MNRLPVGHVRNCHPLVGPAFVNQGGSLLEILSSTADEAYGEAGLGQGDRRSPPNSPSCSRDQCDRHGYKSTLDGRSAV